MNAPDPMGNVDAWTDANQRLLVAEFARLKELLNAATRSGESHGTGSPADALIAQSLSAPALAKMPAAIDHLAALLGLSDFERSVLLLAAGIEMDSELAALCAAAPGGPQRPWATLGLALAALPGAHWSALTPTRPLRRWRLLETGTDASLVTARLRIDERVLHFLAGINELDARLEALLREVPVPALMSDAQRATAKAIAADLGLANPDRAVPLVQLWGKDTLGKRDVAAALAAGYGMRLYALAEEDIAADLHEIQALVTLWDREATLQRAALLIDCGDAQPGVAALRFAKRVRGLTLLATQEPVLLDQEDLRYRVDKPDRQEQLMLWRQALGASAAGEMGAALEGVTSEFRLSVQEIARNGARLARMAAQQRAGSVPSTLASNLWQACRGLNRLNLDGLAQRIEALAGWDDLILPDAPKQSLRQIATQVRHQITVCERWGFAQKSARGLGISVLFAGESGTGKTMAAEVLAQELHLELYRIDLSAVVSKYIGETEKNLARVFDAAEDSGTVLLFDEADALFGKRSEVRDSHDRYANIEVSYLLQRMEAYRGLAILTTNQKAALDSAFQRRLRFIVHFPFPDMAEREAIWRGAFPAATPLEGIEYAKLARLSMAGGNIRNIALNAAFHAADAGAPVGMAHLLRAAHSEAAKRDRAITEAETRGWV